MAKQGSDVKTQSDGLGSFVPARFKQSRNSFIFTKEKHRMPLLKGRFVTPTKSVADSTKGESIYTIPYTNEQFRSKEYPCKCVFRLNPRWRRPWIPFMIPKLGVYYVCAEFVAYFIVKLYILCHYLSDDTKYVCFRGKCKNADFTVFTSKHCERLVYMDTTTTWIQKGGSTSVYSRLLTISCHLDAICNIMYWCIWLSICP